MNESMNNGAQNSSGSGQNSTPNYSQMTPTPPPQPNKKNLIIAIVAIIVILGGGLWYLQSRGSQPDDGDQNDETDQTDQSDDSSETGSETNPEITAMLAAQTKIAKFENYEELRQYLSENSDSNYYGRSSGAVFGEAAMGKKATTSLPMMDTADSAQNISPATSTGATQSESSDRDYSQTNVQVQGVDESDIIKTDGDYIYAVSKNNLYIVKAYPPENSEIISKVEFKNTPQDMYIDGDYLVIFGQDNQINQDETFKSILPPRYSSYTFLKVFDISDKKNPKQIRDLDFEGNYYNSRKIGDYVYFVTQQGAHIYDDPMPMPVIVENGAIMAQPEKEAINSLYYFDIPYDDYNYTTVTAINVADNQEKINPQTYLLGYGQNMFVSQENMYIAYTRYFNEEDLLWTILKDTFIPEFSAEDRKKIAEIEEVPNYILNREEKMEKIGRIIELHMANLPEEEQDQWEEKIMTEGQKRWQEIAKELEKTIVHKIALDGADLEYKTFGEVPGHVLNQFSMDEHDGYFRIATTNSRQFSEFAPREETESYSNVYVLNPEMKIVGQVEKIAKGEQIYSTRFMQNRVYMVTFRQTDPFFVIDLKDPTKPTILGELKIPGFSQYLHPYDDTTIIGLGHDADETGRQKGVKLALFDVSNVSTPKEIDNYVFQDAYSSTEASYDHKAFLFSAEKNILAIPVTMYQPEGANELKPTSDTIFYPDYNNVQFRGAALFSVDKTSGFELKTLINHYEKDDQDDQQEYWYGYNYYDTTVKRSLYIEDTLYTFSNKYLKMNNLKSLEEVNKIELKKIRRDQQDDFEVVN